MNTTAKSSAKITKSEVEWRKQLTPAQYHVNGTALTFDPKSGSK